VGGITNPVHLAFIAVIALVVLGPKRLPDLARTLGNGLREFREAISMEARTPAQTAPPVEAESTYAVAAPEPVPAGAGFQMHAAPTPAEQQVATSALVAPTPDEPELAAPPPAA
jgi:sec-independent protein translocase protein TatA